MKNGFTLVELCIVFVAMGLMIAGIVMAKGLYESGRIQSQIAQIQEFDAAFYGFKSKFRQLPGDSDLLANPGDNDRIIENDKTLGAPEIDNRQLAEEKANFWAHLAESGLLKGKYTNTPLNAKAPYVYQAGKNAPKSAINGFTVVTIFHTAENLPNTPARMFWLLTNYDSSKGSGGMSAENAAAIDVKLDDGKGYEFSDNRKTVYSPITNCTNKAGKYDVESVRNCALAIEIGVASEQ